MKSTKWTRSFLLLFSFIILIFSFQNLSSSSRDIVWTGKGLDSNPKTALNWHKGLVPSFLDRVYLGTDIDSRYLALREGNKLAVSKAIGPGYSTNSKFMAVQSGGEMSTSSYWIIGHTFEGVAFVDQGKIVVRDLLLGQNGGSGNLYLSDGNILVTGQAASTGLYIPADNKSSGFLNISRGVLRTERISLTKGGKINISGTGLLEVLGDQRVLLSKFQKEGLLSADNGLSNLKIYYNKTKDITEVYSFRWRDNIRSRYQHNIVNYNSKMFYAWPANGGIWNWGSEIVVQYYSGAFETRCTELKQNHCVVANTKPEIAQSRSLDGGLTWKAEPFTYSREWIPSGGLNFKSPNFAFKIRFNKMFYSLNKGKTWIMLKDDLLPLEASRTLNSRNDYRIINNKSMQVCVSDAPSNSNDEDTESKSYCMKTEDGGRVFKPLSKNLGAGISEGTIMPSTIILEKGEQISILRGKRNLYVEKSIDSGVTWKNMATFTNIWNPGTLLQLADGRLMMVYGFRRDNKLTQMTSGIAYRLSLDNGDTWTSEKIIRDDGDRFMDTGYPRAVVRPDGGVVIVYYYNTKVRKETHIDSTLLFP